MWPFLIFHAFVGRARLALRYTFLNSLTDHIVFVSFCDADVADRSRMHCSNGCAARSGGKGVLLKMSGNRTIVNSPPIHRWVIVGT